MDHRRLQRTLFRMQLDAGFAARLFAGEPAAAASTSLDSAGLALLRGLDPIRVAADPGGRRSAQVLGNVSSEFALSVSLALGSGRRGDFLREFTASPEFHHAIVADERLPFAFGAYAERVARASGDEHFAALVRLETAMVRARRERRTSVTPPRGAVMLAPTAWLVELAAGTFDWAAVARSSVDAGAALPPPPADAKSAGNEGEIVLLHAAEAPIPWRLADVGVELLEGAVAHLLAAALTPLDRSGIVGVARELDVAASEVDAFIDVLVSDHVLVIGA